MINERFNLCVRIGNSIDYSLLQKLGLNDGNKAL
jgi:hypothetical protein